MEIEETKTPKYSTDIQVNLFQKLSFLNQLTHKYCFECQNKNKKTIFVHKMFWTCIFRGNSMNNLLSYCGLTDARMRASEKYLPVNILKVIDLQKRSMIFDVFCKHRESTLHFLQNIFIEKEMGKILKTILIFNMIVICNTKSQIVFSILAVWMKLNWREQRYFLNLKEIGLYVGFSQFIQKMNLSIYKITLFKIRYAVLNLAI